MASCWFVIEQHTHTHTNIFRSPLQNIALFTCWQPLYGLNGRAKGYGSNILSNTLYNEHRGGRDGESEVKRDGGSAGKDKEQCVRLNMNTSLKHPHNVLFVVRVWQWKTCFDFFNLHRYFTLIQSASQWVQQQLHLLSAAFHVLLRHTKSNWHMVFLSLWGARMKYPSGLKVDTQMVSVFVNVPDSCFVLFFFSRPKYVV